MMNFACCAEATVTSRSNPPPIIAPSPECRPLSIVLPSSTTINMWGSSANWTGIESLDVTVFDDTIQASTDTDAFIKRLEPFGIICTMRERTKFPADILNHLSNLKLLTTTAMDRQSFYRYESC